MAAQNSNTTRNDRGIDPLEAERDPKRGDAPAKAQRVADGTPADADANPDAITGEPGSHPAGTAIGGVSGAATGAMVGAIGGPIGAAIGGVAGAVVGGLIGKGIGEAVDPTEDDYWRDTYEDRPYHQADRDYIYDDYEPAYRLGYNAYDAHGAEYSDETDAQLAKVYEQRKANSRLDWDEARPAVRDAYDRRAQQRRAEAGA